METKMATFGRSPLELLKDSLDYITWKRFSLGFERMVNRTILAFNTRNEVIGGGLVSAGAGLAAGSFNIDFSGLTVLLRGRRKATMGAFVNQDLLTKFGDIEQPIFIDGADASALSLGLGESAYCALIACDSDGADDVDFSERGPAKLVLVVNGTALTYDAANIPPTSNYIQRALRLSTGVHAHPNVRWVWLAHLLVERSAMGVMSMTVTLNGNNVLAI